MHDNTLFWQVFAAVIGANLLTVCFVWGMVNYSRHEQQGTAGSGPTHKYALALLLPMFFAVSAVMIALDGVPKWLDAILQ